MKLIIAIIQPYRLDEVKKSLYAADVNLITVSEVLGHGRQVLGRDDLVGVDILERQREIFLENSVSRSRSTTTLLSRRSMPSSKARVRGKSAMVRFSFSIFRAVSVSVPAKKARKPSANFWPAGF